MDVFLDHHGVDVDDAQRLARALEAAGREVLIDDDSVVPERAWLRAVGDRGLRAPFLFILATPRTPDDWLAAHERLAIAQHAWAERDGRPLSIVPVLLGGRKLDPSSALARWPAADVPAPPDLARGAMEALGRDLDRWASRPGLDKDIVRDVMTRGPFPGLRAFNASRATLFMGRDEVIRDCLQRVVEDDVRWLQIEGASGVGKTSLVRAGLLVALQVGDRAPFGPSWCSCIVRPGTDPVYDLALALHKSLDIDPAQLPPEELAARLLGDDKALVDLVERDLPQLGHRGLLLVLDQLDDGFTQQPLYPEAFEPFDRLIARTVMSSSPFRLVSTVRSDRLDDFRTMPQVEGLLNLPTTARYHLAPLREDELRAAIVDPLHLVGATVPDELVEELITLAEPESFRLSKLAVVLRALWADAVKRDAMRPALSMADLQALRAVQARPADVLEEPYEGLRNVFSRVMDRSLEGLSASELEAARDMLIHVVRPGRANEDMRCMKPRGEVVHATDHLASPKARRVLEKLAGPAEDRRPTGLEPFRVIESLNTSGDAESLDLRHDVLLTDWRILAVWLEEARDILERRDELMLLETKTDPFDDKTLSDATCVRLLGEDLDRVSRARYEGVLDERARQFLGELQARRPTPIARRVPRWVAAAALLLLGIFVGGSIWLVDYLDRLDDDNRMAAVRIAGNDEASHATRILLSGVRRPQRQEAWSDDVVASLERPAARRSLVGPCSEILDLDASADGAMIAAGCADGRVAWWSIDNPSVAGVLDAHSLAVRSVAMAADGTWLVSSSHDGDALIVPLDGESEPRRLEGNGQPLTNIAADPRGRLVIAGSHDGTAKVWKVEDGELLGELAGHRGWVQLVEVSPDGRRVLTVAKDGKARVWTLPGRYLELPTQTAVLDHGGQWIPAAHFSPDGARILTGAVSGEVRIWTFDEEGEPVAEVLGRHDRGIVSAHFDRTGTRVVSTGGDERVQIWPLTAEGSRATLELDGAAPVSAAFAPSGDDVLVAVEGGEVWRWTPGEDDDFVRYTSGRTELRDLVVRSEPAQLVTGTADGVARVWDLDQRLVPEAVTPDVSIASAWFGGEEDNRLVAALAEGGARIFDRTTGQLTGAIIEGQLDGAGIAPGASRVATILNGRVRIWSTEELAAPQTVGPSDVEVSRVAFGPDGEVLAALGGDGVLRIYVAASGREVRTIRLRRENIVTFAFDPRGRVVTGGSTGSVDVWKVEGGIAIKSFEGLPGEVLAVAMGEERVVAGGDRVATVWSLQDPEFRADLAGHQGAVREVSITEDGAYVLTVSDDRVARLWEVKRPDSPLGRSEEGCSAFQAALLADDDGPRVAVACRNGPAELWKPNGAAMRLSREGTSVSQVTFSPDGAELLTASDEGPVAIWPASVDRLRGALLDGVEPCLTPGERARFLGEDPETAAARWRGCARACWDRTFPEDQPVERFTCPTKPR